MDLFSSEDGRLHSNKGKYIQVDPVMSFFSCIFYSTHDQCLGLIFLQTDPLNSAVGATYKVLIVYF